MVTPQISGPPQLVQMTATPHGIPIMVPYQQASREQDFAHGKPADMATVQQASGGTGGGEDRDDTSSQASSEASDRESSAPPTKRFAVDIGGRPGTRIHSGATSVAPAGFMMTPARHMVPTSHFGPQHVIQMGPNSHIPIVMPTSTATGFVSHTSSPMETVVSNGVVVKDDSRRSPLENGACSPHLISGGCSSKPTQVISASHLLHMTSPHHSVPLVLPTNAIHLSGGHHHHGNSSKHRSSPSSSVDRTHPSSSMATDKSHHASKYNGGVLGSTSLKMPFANIAIQSGTLQLYTQPYIQYNWATFSGVKVLQQTRDFSRLVYLVILEWFEALHL